MKKALLWIAGLGTLFIAIIYFSFMGTINQIVREISVPKHHIGIKLKNDSGKDISKVQFFVGETLTDSLSSVKSNDNIVKHLKWLNGEGTFSVKVTFNDGKQLKSEYEYAEPGYYVTKVVQNDSIHTQYN